MENEDYQRLLNSLQRLCSKTEYCSKDIYSKALRKSDAPTASLILGDLRRDGFVDDARYAVAFAREKAALTGWGPIKIRSALAAKGISGEGVTLALQEVDPARSRERLQHLLESRAKNLHSDPQAKLKLLKYALSRGYEYDSIREIVDGLI